MLFNKNYYNVDQIDPLCKILFDQEETIKLIESKFECHKSYLDHDFEKFFCTEQNFLPRLWELSICDTLRQSNYEHYLKPTSGKGPDFCLIKVLHDKNIYIENVCPNRPQKGKESLFENKSFKIETAENSPINITYSGVDERIIARYASNIRDKSAKFINECQYTEGHYRVLCISGARLGRWKSELHNSKLIRNTHWEFENCVLGKPIMYFPKNPDEESPSDFSYVSFPISKGETTFNVGQHEDNTVFDAIVFSDLVPFVGWSSSKTYTIFYRNDTSQGLKNLLDEIFYK